MAIGKKAVFFVTVTKLPVGKDETRTADLYIVEGDNHMDALWAAKANNILGDSDFQVTVVRANSMYGVVNNDEPLGM